MGFLRVWKRVFEGAEEAFWGCERGSLARRNGRYGLSGWCKWLIVNDVCETLKTRVFAPEESSGQKNGGILRLR